MCDFIKMSVQLSGFPTACVSKCWSVCLASSVPGLSNESVRHC